MSRDPYDDRYSDRDDDRYPDYDDRYDDYDEDYYRPRRRYRRRGAPHRGGLILGLGIASFFVCGLIGLIPWIMGNNDLREMRAGRVDREGEGLTYAGRICGMIAFWFTIAIIIIYAIIIALFVALEQELRGF